MTDTPRSGSRTRFSTPVSDLDDHRFQEESLPRVEHRTGSRRGTFTSMTETRPDMAALNAQLEMGHGSIARDFEQTAAVIEDDQITTQSEQGTEPWRRISLSAPIGRKGTLKRHDRERQNSYQDPDAQPSRSRDTSRSRSTSPPNSVDAFAPPQRRRRAGTVTSQPSVTNLTLQRTVSNSTHPRGRRPTFSEVKSTHTVESRRSSVEDDVCFPPDRDASKTYTIDYEELEEFVAETHDRTPCPHPFSQQLSRSTPSEVKIFNDLRPTKTNSSFLSLGHGSSSEEKIDEKVEAQQAGETDAHRLAGIPENFNRFTFFSSEADDTVHASELGDLLMPGETFRDLFELGPDGGVWWLDMLNPSEEEVFAICKAFGVHPLTREDITTQETREKVELFRSYYFVCFRSFYQEDKTSELFMEPINVYAVVFREGLLTFTFCANPHAANVRKRIGRLRDYVNLSSDWICYALIDDIVDAFGPVLRDVEIEADAIEDQVFVARFEDSRQILRQISECRKKVMSLLRLLGGKADVIKGFAKRCNDQYSMAPRGDVGLYLSDVQDHVVTMMSNLSHFEKMNSRSHSNYLAQISVDNITQGNKANSLLSKVTVLATILVPLNLVTGLFGMNVRVPGMDAGNLGWWFGILGFMILFVCVCFLTAMRMGLLRRD
ncbi:hypothetical protein AAFC00_003486 [Neodothiora populina]|uniref:Uncharacterized protein n=1 Tax=Neodothiora populina TaxID=2781224 RepID=A0ABR3PEB7_9PEZI